MQRQYNLVERLVENDLAEDVIATKDIAYCSSVRPWFYSTQACIKEKHTHNCTFFSLSRCFQLKKRCNCSTQLTYLICLCLLYFCSYACYLWLYIYNYSLSGIRTYIDTYVYHKNIIYTRQMLNAKVLLFKYVSLYFSLALIKTYINNIIMYHNYWSVRKGI